MTASWAEFALACALGCALLLVPGTLVLRRVGARLSQALCLAPLVSVFAYGSLSVVLSAAGVPCTFFSVAALPVAALLAACARARAHVRRARWGGSGRRLPRDLVTLVPYGAAGILVTGFVLVSNLDGPASLIQAWDNVCHFNLVRSMQESHVWTTLSTTYYPGEMARIDPFPGSSGYYPVAWHLVSVLLVDALGISPTMAGNVTNALCAGVVFPLGVCALLGRVFERRPRVVACGALCCLAFASFPWNLIVRWTLYPNLLSFALLPAEVAALLLLFGERALARRRVAAGVAAACGGVTLALVQPNAVFSAAVFLVPYATWRVWSRYAGRFGRRYALGRALLVACLVLLVWMTLYGAPFMRGVVGYFWQPMMDAGAAVRGVLAASFVGGGAQPVVSAVLLVGVLAGLALPEVRWAVAAFALSSAIFVVAVSGDDGMAKHLLSGFWYTDPYRVAAMSAVYAVPLASLGLQVLADGAARVAGALADRLAAGRRLPLRAGWERWVVLVAFAALVFGPAVAARAGDAALAGAGELGRVSLAVAERNRAEGRAGYDAEKMAFVERVRALVGPDELVLNQPYDGSLYAYGASGLNVYYRYMSGYGDGGETRESLSIRTGLARLASGARPDVVAALARTGARYLMILDRDREGFDRPFPPYRQERWRGIDAVDDATPGFEAVLAEGDMRLYRIVAEGGGR